MTDGECGLAIPMDPDDAFDAMANSRRRQVILSVSRTNEAISAGDLSVEIAAVENLVDPSEVTSEQRTRVYTALVQGHLKTLDELGVIKYDERSKQVAPTEVTQPLARHIRRIKTACYKPTEDAQ